jgi:hypothetical protein
LTAPIRDRDNKDRRRRTGSKPGWGTHDVKGGVEGSLVLRGGNSQSSGLLFNTDYASTAGKSLTGPAAVIPVDPGARPSATRCRRARFARTTSFYCRSLMSRLTLDLGLRTPPAKPPAACQHAQRSCRASPPYALREDGHTVLARPRADSGRYTSAFSAATRQSCGRVTSVYNGPRAGL